MTQQFHEGQEVYVSYPDGNLRQSAEAWRKAKIVTAMVHTDDPENNRYEVKFPDGTRAVFDAEHIRAIPWGIDDPDMTQQFYEGQEVEVRHPWQYCPSTHCERAQECRSPNECNGRRKAKIIRVAPDGGAIFNPVYETTLGLFDAAQIKAVAP